MHRVLFVTYGCYLDSSNGASVASRAMLEAISREALSQRQCLGYPASTAVL